MKDLIVIDIHIKLVYALDSDAAYSIITNYLGSSSLPILLMILNILPMAAMFDEII
jgi:hypothetical protein